MSQALQEVFAEVGSGTVDETGQDAFALVAPLPDGVVDAVLKTLALPNNDPIAQQAVSGTFSPGAAGGSAAPPAGGTSPGRVSTLQRVLRTTCLGGVLFIIIIAMAAARALGRARRR